MKASSKIQMRRHSAADILQLGAAFGSPSNNHRAMIHVLVSPGGGRRPDGSGTGEMQYL
jgi:hypothetical protein